jgi:hypothetical protein
VAPPVRPGGTCASRPPELSVARMRQMICEGSLDSSVERLIAFKLRCFVRGHAAEVQLLNTLLRYKLV